MRNPIIKIVLFCSVLIFDYITLQELGNYEIFSSTGEFIANGVNIDGKVNTENLPAGIYFVKINSKSYKFVKE
jgi:hypothetical protein